MSYIFKYYIFMKEFLENELFNRLFGEIFNLLLSNFFIRSMCFFFFDF